MRSDLYIGLDVSLDQTSVCVVDESGGTVWRGRCKSTPDDIAATIQRHAPDVARVGLECGQLSTWLFHELKARGLPVVCIDARHAKAALSLKINKTDANDAYGIAHRSLRGPVLHRPQHRIREATPPCPERGLHGSSRSKEFAVAGARPGRDSFPLCSATELVSLMLLYAAAKRSSSQRKVELSRHILCRITASLRATATCVFLLPTVNQ